MEDKVEFINEDAEGEAAGYYEFAHEAEGDSDEQEKVKSLTGIKNGNQSWRNDDNLRNTYAKPTGSLRGKASISTPDTKLNSTQFSSSKLGGRGNSMQIDSRRKRMSDRNENDGNETFITSSDYHHQMSAMDERITKIENLVWSLYKELNGKIENSFANCQLETTEMAQQVAQQLGGEIHDLRSSLANIQHKTHFVPRQSSLDEGYEGSEENIEDDIRGQNSAFADPNYMKGSLDEVVEEISSQYDSNMDKSNEK